MQARLIEEIGTKAWLRVYWDDYDKDGQSRSTCPNVHGEGHAGYHDAKVFLAKTPTKHDWELGGDVKDYKLEQFPQQCDGCGAPVPFGAPSYTWGQEGTQLSLQVFRKTLYSTASGDPEPGDLFWADWYHSKHEGVERCLFWDNCKGPHLMAVLPNGHHWDIDSRASNCASPEDRIHRCWVKEGTPPNITVGKGGVTCAAGAGSIAAGKWGKNPPWHGFLRNGQFVL